MQITQVCLLATPNKQEKSSTCYRIFLWHAIFRVGVYYKSPKSHTPENTPKHVKISKCTFYTILGATIQSFGSKKSGGAFIKGGLYQRMVYTNLMPLKYCQTLRLNVRSSSQRKGIKSIAVLMLLLMVSKVAGETLQQAFTLSIAPPILQIMLFQNTVKFCFFAHSRLIIMKYCLPTVYFSLFHYKTLGKMY